MTPASAEVPESTQRLFVGLWPPPAALTHAQAHLVPFHDRLPGGRWIPLTRWHVTLAFLGDVPVNRVAAISTILDEVGRAHAPLTTMHLQGAGTFRGVLWLGLVPTERHSPADRLARHVQRELRRAGLPIERRPWRAHVTVARWKSGTDTVAAARSLGRALDDYRGPEFTIDSFSLVKSDNGPNPVHVELNRTRLNDMHR